MKTHHRPIYDDYLKDKKAQVNQLKRKSDDEQSNGNHKRTKIENNCHGSTVMKLCVDLVVNCGRPFSIFKDEAMKSLIDLAKLQTSETIQIHPESVKRAVQHAAGRKRSEIGELLSKKVLSFSLDMVTCRQRTFIGKTGFLMQ